MSCLFAFVAGGVLVVGFVATGLVGPRSTLNTQRSSAWHCHRYEKCSWVDSPFLCHAILEPLWRRRAWSHDPIMLSCLDGVPPQLFFQPLSQSLRMVMHLGEPLPADRPTFYFDFAVLVLFFMVRYKAGTLVPQASSSCRFAAGCNFHVQRKLIQCNRCFFPAPRFSSLDMLLNATWKAWLSATVENCSDGSTSDCRPTMVPLFLQATYFGMIWTNGAGASTGMFVPALAVGATGGRMAGRIVKAIVRCVGKVLPVFEPCCAYKMCGRCVSKSRLPLMSHVMSLQDSANHSECSKLHPGQSACDACHMRSACVDATADGSDSQVYATNTHLTY